MRVLVAVWVLAVSAGMCALVRFDSTPAPPHEIADRWPTSSAIALDANRPNLVMAVHPRCSCTQASLNELARMLPLIPDTRIVVLLTGERGNRYETQVRDMRLEAVADQRGAEAHRFGLTTSGEVAIYSAAGGLLYHGGLTGARGHEGDNPGEATARSVLKAAASGKVKDAPVFGCALDSKAP